MKQKPANHCLYCDALLPYPEDDQPPVPAIDDDQGWRAEAQNHIRGCEWIRTRAHRKDKDHYLWEE
jgi:hypothetical protein